MWHIGQDVVALATVTTKSGVIILKKDEVYQIKGLAPMFCKCGGLMLDVGVSYHTGFQLTCGVCKTKSTTDYAAGTNIWFGEKVFAPLDSLVNIEELLDAYAIIVPQNGDRSHLYHCC